MVSESKTVGRDESTRLDQLTKKLEVAQVTRVYTHNEPGDVNWQVCDVIIQDCVPLNGAPVSDEGPDVRLRIPVTQQFTGNRAGHPWTPKCGDSVLIAHYMNDRAVIIAQLPPQWMLPVCRSSSNRAPYPLGAHEDWDSPDFGNVYDYCLKLTQWLRVERKTMIDDQGRTWYTTFDHSKTVLTNKHRPVCFKYFDKTRDTMMVFECKAGKATPDCNECELNIDLTGKGPDLICACTECSGTNPAMNSWLKVLSSGYTGDWQAEPVDLPRRLRYHHACGSAFCMDSNFPANERFDGCNKHSGRVWLESQVTTCEEGVHCPKGHIQFRALTKECGDDYPETPAGYGKYNLSLRGYKENASHLELWGDNSKKGRCDLANEEIGKVQQDLDHCGTPDAHVSIEEDTGIVIIHSNGDDGGVVVVGKNQVWIKSCSDDIYITTPTKIWLQAAEVEVTGNLKIDGRCTHGACSCPCGGAGGSCYR